MDDEPLGVRVLGVTCLTRGSEVIEIGSPRQRAILATLAAAEGQPVRAELLIDTLWGEELPNSPAAALQTQISRLRELIGSGSIRTTPGGYALAIDRRRIDAWDFVDQVQAAGAWEPARRVDLLAAALSMWHGPAFADVADRPDVQPAAVQLEELALRCREDRAEALLVLGAVDEAAVVSSGLVAAAPLRERALALLMEALYRSGRHGEALARYDEHRRLLAEELGLSPSPLLVDLQRAILRHDVLPTTGRDASPPAIRRRRGRLPPVPVSELVGRRVERDLVVERTATARVVTITGPGGVGKTRLAQHVAHQLDERYRDGVWWCDLASVVAGASPTDVATALAAVLGVDERSGEEIIDRVATVLAGRTTLVVLDNCEHVVAATAELVDELVRSVASVDVLLTSREALAIDGEHRLRLEPLAVPVSDEVSDAVLLFLQRVRAVNPSAATDGRSWDAVLEICRTLDGLPLALEFAAARTAHMSVVDIATQLDHRFDLLAAGQRRTDHRHASLATALEWSYGLLEPVEQDVLDGLALFVGAFTLDDAQRLCAAAPDGPTHATVADAVTSLVDKSLVSLYEYDGVARYRLLDSVRAYSQQRLAAAGALETWRRRHGDFTVDLASRADAGLRGPAEAEWSRRIDEHIGDLRAARTLLLTTGSLDALVQMCASLAWYADPRSRPEVHRWARDAADRARREVPAHPSLSRLYAMAASAAVTRGDLADAEVLAREADAAGEGHTGFGVDVLARIDLFGGRLEAARHHSRTAVDRYRAAGDRHAAIIAATTDVAARAFGGLSEDVRRAALDLLAEATEVGGISALAMCEYCAAEAVIADIDQARAHLHRSIALARSAGTDFIEGLAITALAGLDVRFGRPEAAFAGLHECIDHWERAGMWKQQWWLTLRMLIEALSDAGMHAPVVVLAHAFDASATTGPVYGTDADRLDAAKGLAARTLPEAQYARAVATGMELDDESALAYGRTLLDRILADGSCRPS